MPDELFNKLKAALIKYNPKHDVSCLEDAYKWASEAHKNAVRESGEPYIIHPLEVSQILAGLESDVSTIIAGLLHDVIEDTHFCTLEQINNRFGSDVSRLVDGVTKLARISYSDKEELQAENLRKMLLAMAKDIRVIIIKLADRLHNMRTLAAKPLESRQRIAKETMEIYAPLAHRLGVYSIKWELEDIGFRFLHEESYYNLVKKVAAKRTEREKFIKKIMEEIKSKCDNISIKTHIDGRPKHFYSIYKKMKTQNISFEQIYDLFAIRVIVDTREECYAVLGLVHELYKPLPGRFKDYIAIPKPNMYSSLHNTMIGPEGIAFEIQIRTWEMHRVAEYGIAAHWKYKEGSTGNDALDNKLAWLRQMIELKSNDGEDPDDFIEVLKVDLFANEVFVFTPKGDIINLPQSSTPIDFAYAIHSAVGNRMMGAKINGRMTTLSTELKNGDIVEILTSSSVRGPSRDWLKIVKSSEARNKINQWFKKEKREENVIRGKEIVERELKRLGVTHAQLFKPDWVDIILKRYNFGSIDDMYSSIGYGGTSAVKVISRLMDEYRKYLKPDEQQVEMLSADEAESKTPDKREAATDHGIIVKGIDNCLVRLAKCCNPLPGDSIMGYVTRGRGVTVHRTDCVNIKATGVDDVNRVIEVEWGANTSHKPIYTAHITISAYDRTALITDIVGIISYENLNINMMNTSPPKNRRAKIDVTFSISDIQQFSRIIKKIEKIEGVFDVSRSRNLLR